MTRLAQLPDRAVLALAGADRVAFLQGLVSNDVTEAVAGRAVWAALLTPQGKWLADFFILAAPDRLLLDVDAAQAEDLLRRLARYRLRAAVTLSACPDWAVYAAWDRHRLALGLPDGARDLEADKSVLLEAGFDELHGVSWTKGCYMGQELTARTRYRGLVKRRLVPVAIAGPAPAPGAPILRADTGAEAGTMRSARDGAGLALLRLDALAAPLRCGGATMVAHPPGWMRLPETAPREMQA